MSTYMFGSQLEEYHIKGEYLIQYVTSDVWGMIISNLSTLQEIVNFLLVSKYFYNLVNQIELVKSSILEYPLRFFSDLPAVDKKYYRPLVVSEIHKQTPTLQLIVQNQKSVKEIAAFNARIPEIISAGNTLEDKKIIVQWLCFDEAAIAKEPELFTTETIQFVANDQHQVRMNALQFYAYNGALEQMNLLFITDENILSKESKRAMLEDKNFYAVDLAIENKQIEIIKTLWHCADPFENVKQNLLKKSDYNIITTPSHNGKHEVVALILELANEFPQEKQAILRENNYYLLRGAVESIKFKYIESEKAKSNIKQVIRILINEMLKFPEGKAYLTTTFIKENKQYAKLIDPNASTSLSSLLCSIF